MIHWSKSQVLVTGQNSSIWVSSCSRISLWRLSAKLSMTLNKIFWPLVMVVSLMYIDTGHFMRLNSYLNLNKSLNGAVVNNRSLFWRKSANLLYQQWEWFSLSLKQFWSLSSRIFRAWSSFVTKWKSRSGLALF